MGTRFYPPGAGKKGDILMPKPGRDASRLGAMALATVMALSPPPPDLSKNIKEVVKHAQLTSDILKGSVDSGQLGDLVAPSDAGRSHIVRIDQPAVSSPSVIPDHLHPFGD